MIGWDSITVGDKYGEESTKWMDGSWLTQQCESETDTKFYYT